MVRDREMEGDRERGRKKQRERRERGGVMEGTRANARNQKPYFTRTVV